MAFNGSGLFTRLYNWVNDAANSINIKADRMDAEMDGFAAGLSNCLTRDGQGKPSTAIDWNNQNLNNVNTLAANGATFAAAITAGDSSSKGATTAFVQTSIQSAGAISATAAGTADAITAMFAPAIAVLTAGMTLLVRAANANATTTPTLQVNATAAKTIVKGNNQPLVAGDIAGAGHWLELTYDATLDKWILANPAYPAAYTTALTASSINGGPLAGFRSRVINGNFAINQRAVSGTVTLAAGAYGHDRWKAGAAGCTYTFAASGADTVITITAGSLMQVIEGANVEGGNYRLSQAGTAQARCAINGNTTTGAYSANPQTILSATGGLAITVEFTTGTVSKVQVEPGTQETPFERRFYGAELDLCKRYTRRLKAAFGVAANAATAQFYIDHFGMRATPSASVTATISVTDSATGFSQSVANIRITSNAVDGGVYSCDNFTGMTPFRPVGIAQPSGDILLTAEL